MGAVTSRLDRKKVRVSVNSEAEDDLSSTAYQNLLRLTILDNIRLEFQRPTTILLYGCPYGCLDSIAEFLTQKLQFGSVKCGINQCLESDPMEILEGPQNFGIIFQNYPQNFDQVLSLQSLKIDSQLVVIFLNSSYANLIKIAQMEWTHPSSGRKYHVIDQPPKSMEGRIACPANMLDDVTNEPLVQSVTRDQCVRDLMAYDKMKTEMWSQWVSFRHCLNADVDLRVLQNELVQLLCGVIADQSSGKKRVITSQGIKVQSSPGIGGG